MPRTIGKRRRFPQINAEAAPPAAAAAAPPPPAQPAAPWKPKRLEDLYAFDKRDAQIGEGTYGSVFTYTNRATAKRVSD